MVKFNQAVARLHGILLSRETKERSERVIIVLALIAFVLHLLLIFVVDQGWLEFADPSKLLTNPIAAVYTPFSFILIYEVYLLVYYLPRSITVYIGKQYEIIMLILVRRLFKDMANLQITSDWFQVQGDLQFTFDIVGTLVLFYLIYLFRKLNPRKLSLEKETVPSNPRVQRFIRQKKATATGLVILILVLASYRLVVWIVNHWSSVGEFVTLVKDVNKVFFDEFFTILILTDVLLLLLSFLHTHRFSTIIRNSGFIISTILIRMSFGVEGLLNTVLIVVAVLFGVLILWIHNQYKKTGTQAED